MKKRTFLSRLALTGMMIISMGIFAGCSSQSSESALSGNEAEALASGGTLVLRVNPEIAVEYDENGRVTAVRGKNEDGKDIVAGYQDYIGKECREVVGDLVSAIHEAGYFVEEVEGEGRKITIEIETGSALPGDQFLEEIVTDIKQYVTDMNMNSPVVVEGETDYGVTIYENTDYGVSAYDASPYDASPYDETPYEIEIPVTPAPSGETPAAPQETTDYSPYEESNYTPYEETDYSPYEESAYTPYVEPAAPVTPPAPAVSQETTDYSPYEESNYTPYEESNYTPYEESNYTPYEESAYSPYEESAYEESDYSPYEESNYSDYDE